MAAEEKLAVQGALAQAPPARQAASGPSAGGDGAQQPSKQSDNNNNNNINNNNNDYKQTAANAAGNQATAGQKQPASGTGSPACASGTCATGAGVGTTSTGEGALQESQEPASATPNQSSSSTNSSTRSSSQNTHSSTNTTTTSMGKFKEKRPEPLKLTAANLNQDIPLDLSVKSAGNVPSGAHIFNLASANRLTTLETPRIMWQDNEALLIKPRLFSNSTSASQRLRLSSLSGESPPITPSTPSMLLDMIYSPTARSVAAAAVAAAAAAAVPGQVRSHHHHPHHHHHHQRQPHSASSLHALMSAQFQYNNSKHRTAALFGLDSSLDITSSFGCSPNNNNNNNNNSTPGAGRLSSGAINNSIGTTRRQTGAGGQQLRANRNHAIATSEMIKTPRRSYSTEELSLFSGAMNYYGAASGRQRQVRWSGSRTAMGAAGTGTTTKNQATTGDQLNDLNGGQSQRDNVAIRSPIINVESQSSDVSMSSSSFVDTCASSAASSTAPGSANLPQQALTPTSGVANATANLLNIHLDSPTNQQDNAAAQAAPSQPLNPADQSQAAAPMADITSNTSLDQVTHYPNYGQQQQQVARTSQTSASTSSSACFSPSNSNHSDTATCAHLLLPDKKAFGQQFSEQTLQQQQFVSSTPSLAQANSASSLASASTSLNTPTLISPSQLKLGSLGFLPSPTLSPMSVFELPSPLLMFAPPSQLNSSAQSEQRTSGNGNGAPGTPGMGTGNSGGRLLQVNPGGQVGATKNMSEPALAAAGNTRLSTFMLANNSGEQQQQQQVVQQRELPTSQQLLNRLEAGQGSFACGPGVAPMKAGSENVLNSSAAQHLEAAALSEGNLAHLVTPARLKLGQAESGPERLDGDEGEPSTRMEVEQDSEDCDEGEACDEDEDCEENDELDLDSELSFTQAGGQHQQVVAGARANQWAKFESRAEPAGRPATVIPKILVSDCLLRQQQQQQIQASNGQQMQSATNWAQQEQEQSTSADLLECIGAHYQQQQRFQRDTVDKRALSPQSFRARVHLYHSERLESSSAPPDVYQGRARPKIKSATGASEITVGPLGGGHLWPPSSGELHSSGSSQGGGEMQLPHHYRPGAPYPEPGSQPLQSFELQRGAWPASQQAAPAAPPGGGQEPSYLGFARQACAQQQQPQRLASCLVGANRPSSAEPLVRQTALKQEQESEGQMELQEQPHLTSYSHFSQSAQHLHEAASAWKTQPEPPQQQHHHHLHHDHHIQQWQQSISAGELRRIGAATPGGGGSTFMLAQQQQQQPGQMRPQHRSAPLGAPLQQVQQQQQAGAGFRPNVGGQSSAAAAQNQIDTSQASMTGGSGPLDNLLRQQQEQALGPLGPTSNFTPNQPVQGQLRHSGAAGARASLGAAAGSSAVARSAAVDGQLHLQRAVVAAAAAQQQRQQQTSAALNTQVRALSAAEQRGEPQAPPDFCFRSSSAAPGAVKKYRCDVCDKAFTRSDMLTRHKRLHSGDRPFQCNGCKQVFSRSDHLSTHMRTHTGEKPYKCKLCPYSACRKDMITRHMKVHNRSSPNAHATGLEQAPAPGGLLAPPR